MVPPLKGDDHLSTRITNMMSSFEDETLSVAFSHIHIYVDKVEDVSVYQELEDKLNSFSSAYTEDSAIFGTDWNSAGSAPLDVTKCRTIWKSLANNRSKDDREEDGVVDEGSFVPQNRDVVKQLIAGLGFRVTGQRIISSENRYGNCNSRSVLVTSRDFKGVQIVVSAVDNAQLEDGTPDEYCHFDAAKIRHYFKQHSNRQGIAVLAFEVTSGAIETIFYRYRTKHPKLLTEKGVVEYVDAKVLEVYAYYQNKKWVSDADTGTMLRFVEPSSSCSKEACILPGITRIAAKFDITAMPAYCDHWVSNVVSRTGFLDTLEDTLHFTPKVNFNAGVVAAGEAQIESTVTGNTSPFFTSEKERAIKDQSQVYLPINNALSDVGHVYGFLREIGQGVQHIASRVSDLVGFVQRANDFRKITDEGFTFLKIPRSYYGVLSAQDLSNGVDRDGKLLTIQCATAVVDACKTADICTVEGAVDLDLGANEISALIDDNLKCKFNIEYKKKKEDVIKVILRSRHKNLYALLGDHLSEQTYLGVVRNQILVDVQGDDLLFQIFTSNILQRDVGHESPFFEFIQRICSECTGPDGCPAKIKPGCGGFGIRNFLTLFLSIEASNAMLQMAQANAEGNEEVWEFASKMVDIFTDQLNESNPILTEITNAMTFEETAMTELNSALSQGNEEAALVWRAKVDAACAEKLAGNQKLVACSAKYKALMKSLRENRGRRQLSYECPSA